MAEQDSNRIIYTDGKLFATLHLSAIYDSHLYRTQEKSGILSEENFIKALKERKYDLFESKLTEVARATDAYWEIYRFNTESDDPSQQVAYLVLPKSFRTVVNSSLGTTIPEGEDGLANIVVQTFFLKREGLQGFRALPK